METQKERVVVIGSSGLIGREVAAQLARPIHGKRYAVVGATRSTQPALDLEDAASIVRFFEHVGPVQHVVVAAGDARFQGFEHLDRADLEVGVRSKLLGQVEVALAALRRVPPGGSVTLTSGALSHAPVPGSAAVAMVNGAIDAFVRAIALDTPPGRRINVVSPGWIRETMCAMGMDPTPGVAARDVARLYIRAIESDAHGAVISEPSAGPIQVRGIDHVVLRVQDLDGMIAFYTGVLGCTLERGPGDARLAQLRAGACLIDLLEVSGPFGGSGRVPEPDAHNVDHFCVLVDPWEPKRLLAHLASHGVRAGEITRRHGGNGWAPSLYLEDPEGNLVELRSALPSAA